METNSDFVEMLLALNASGANYLVVGAYAVSRYTRPRSTGDLDIWIGHDPVNAERVYAALRKFGAPLHELRPADLATPDVVFQIGVVPVRIDILTSISGVEFEGAWERRVPARVQGVDTHVPGREDLIVNKRASGRPKDLEDLRALEHERFS